MYYLVDAEFIFHEPKSLGTIWNMWEKFILPEAVTRTEEVRNRMMLMEAESFPEF